MARQLKVFRTSIGFHDAYVAAASQKAALQAWGADANLFARGMAEEITDPKLMQEPLSRPGEVVRTSRGTMAEHLAALPENKPTRSGTRKPKGAAPRATKAAAAAPRPSRTTLDEAESAAAEAEERYAEQRRALDRREAEIREERRALEAARAKEAERLDAAVAAAAAAYRDALATWRDGRQ